MVMTNCDALRDWLPFVQFKKREKRDERLLVVQLQAKSLQLY